MKPQLPQGDVSRLCPRLQQEMEIGSEPDLEGGAADLEQMGDAGFLLRGSRSPLVSLQDREKLCRTMATIYYLLLLPQVHLRFPLSPPGMLWSRSDGIA